MKTKTRCQKCGKTSGDDWSQCKGVCPMPGSPHNVGEYEDPRAADERLFPADPRDRGVREVRKGFYELQVVECVACGFHLGIDLIYLEQVEGVSLACPSCSAELYVSEAED